MGVINFLLDTHTLLWAIREPNKLSKTAKGALNNAEAQFYVSAVSAYEISYKHKIGKLIGFEDIAKNYLEVLREFGAVELPISAHHAHYAGSFDWIHRDPFDRILAAQAYIEGLTLITNDDVFSVLPWVSILW